MEGTNYTEPEKSMLRIGVDVLPPIAKDTTDRNRTSPVAFTGNKFELRMLGSSQSIAGPNIALNAIMAQELGKFADFLEQAEDFDSALQTLVSTTLREHQRIIFSGNGYSDAWKQEAARRGLSNLASTAQALPTYISQKNIELVTSRGIFTETELRARYAIHLDDYNKKLGIEARTMVDMALHQILPAALRYSRSLCDGLGKKKALGIAHKAEQAMAERLVMHTDALYDAIETLRCSLKDVPDSAEEAARFYRSVVIPAMNDLRREADILEELTDKTYWPYPTYSDILFY